MKVKSEIQSKQSTQGDKLHGDICVTSPTPGPWEQNPEYPDEIVANGKTVAAVTGGKFVGDYYSNPTYIVPGEALANARLISAAPDLRSACEAVLLADENGDWGRAIELCRDAIRKARGVR